jgi:hypothetical protein
MADQYMQCDKCGQIKKEAELVALKVTIQPPTFSFSRERTPQVKTQHICTDCIERHNKQAKEAMDA